MHPTGAELPDGGTSTRTAAPVTVSAGDRGRTESHPIRQPHRRWMTDGAVMTGYLLAALFVTSKMWRHLDRVGPAANDQMLFEWMLARAAHAVTHLENPLYSTQLNAPDGINLMANTSVLGLGIPLAPVTLLFGSRIAFLVAVVLSLAGTAAAWYLFLSRRLVDSRLAAMICGLFCGFAPGMISQATGHLHMIAQFLVPAILWIVFSPETNRVLRQGILLGLLVAYQIFLGEEVLVFLVVASGLFTVTYALVSPARARRMARPFLARLGIGAVTALVPLAYPLWFQFFGPGHYRGLPFDPATYVLDLGSFTAVARQSVTGYDVVPGLLSPNPSEENSFFGLALIVLCAVVVIWQWRRPSVKALGICAIVVAALSLGSQLRINGESTGIPGPYRLISHLPLIDLVVPARFPLICIPIAAILLALSIDQVFRLGAVGLPTQLPVRLLWVGAVLAVLSPLAPKPIPTKPVWPVPQFVASGEWRAYVPPGRTLVPVPPTTGGEAIAGMYWSARTGLAFTAPGGYFIGPIGPRDHQARWGAPDRPTAVLLDRAAQTGQVQTVTDEDRRQAIEDLRYWRAAIVVQGGLHRGEAVRQTLDLLLGSGREISGAWVWDVRAVVG